MRFLNLSTSREHAGQAPRQRGGGRPEASPSVFVLGGGAAFGG